MVREMAEIPAKLYKYRKFDLNALRMVVDHELWYANPASFNDPLDCAPGFQTNIGLKSLNELLRAMYPEDDEAAHKDRINQLEYLSTEMGDFRTSKDAQRYLIRLLGENIHQRLKTELSRKGVLSFAGTCKSPLMWSHYAESHRGICIEFDTSEIPHPFLSPIDYQAPRMILASDLYAWKIQQDDAARKRIEHTYYYAKSPEWEYESEWRDLRDKQGAADGPYQISAIYFGLRCDYAIKVAVVRMLGPESKVNFYDMAFRDDSFDLFARETELDEIRAQGIRPPMEILLHEAFEPVPDDWNG